MRAPRLGADGSPSVLVRAVDAINDSKKGSGFDQLFASIAQKFPGLPTYPADGQSITGASKVGAEASLVTTFSYPNLNEQQNVKTVRLSWRGGWGVGD